MASITAEALLEKVNRAIERRLDADAYEKYGEADRRFEGASLDSLFKQRERLEAIIATSGSNRYRLVRPCDL